MTGVPDNSDLSPGTSVPWRSLLPAALVFLALFQVIAVYVSLKAVRDALFLHSFGALQLPAVMLAIALVVGLFSILTIKLSRRFGTATLAVATLLFFALNLIFFWRLASANPPWLPVVLYLWVGAYGVIAPVQVWTLANQVFSTRQARKWYGAVGAGGILGAIAGGGITSSVARTWGTLALLPLSAAVLLVCALLVAWLSSRYSENSEAEAQAAPEGFRGSLKTILSTPHLSTLAALVFGSALATTLVDFQFKATAGGAGMTRDQLTAFFGASYGAFSVASLAIQMIAVRPLLKRFGLGPAALIAPVSLLLGSSFFGLWGGLTAAVGLKGADSSFKHSVDRCSKELAWLPVPWSVKARTKSLIDMVADRLGDGSGGLILLVLATGLHLPPRSLVFLNLGLAAVWIGLAWRLKKSYYDQLARSLGVGAGFEVSAPLAQRASRQALMQTLASSQGERLVEALDLARLAPGPDLAPALQRMLAADEEADRLSLIKARALEILLPPAERNLPPGMPTQLGPDDRSLMAMGFDLVLAADPAERRARAVALLESEPLETRATQLALLVRRLGEGFTPVWWNILENLADPELPVPPRRLAARTLGLVPEGTASNSLLPRLLADPDLSVRLEAAETASRLADPNMVPHLLPLLGIRQARPIAQRAIAAAAPPVNALVEPLLDPALGWAVRRHLPRLLASIGTGEAVGALVHHLDHADPQISLACLDALAWLRRRNPQVPLLAEADFQRFLFDALTTGRTCLARLRALDRQPVSPRQVELAEALQGDLEQVQRRARLLLQIGLPVAGYVAARQGLTSRSHSRRENSLELIEGLLPRDLKLALIPFLEETSSRMALRRAAEPEMRDPMHDISLVDRLIALRSMRPLQEAPADALLRLAAACRELILARGEAFSLRAQASPPLLLLTSGRMLIRQAGEAPLFAQAQEPGGFTLLALQRQTHLVALKSSRALLLDRENFFEFLAENGEVACSLLDQLLSHPRSLPMPSAFPGPPAGERPARSNS